MDVEEAPQPHYGNAECVAFLERWLNEAKRGEITHVALACVAAPNNIMADSTGTIEMQTEIHVALDLLKSKIDEQVLSRMAPIDPNIGADHVCFNLAAGVASFDFLPWLVNAEMARIAAGAPAPLKIAFFRNAASTRYSAYHNGMLQNVIAPMLSMVDAVPSDVMGGRSDFSLTYKPVVDAYRAGAAVPKFRPTETAREATYDMLGFLEPVTITLREAKHYPHRNSNLPEWLRFADYLAAKGETVIFVRDTARADEEFDNHAICPLASKDLHFRLALYERAKMNYFVSNGPTTLCYHADVPFSAFYEIDREHRQRYLPGWPEWWPAHMGIEVGEQFPWFTPAQRIIWQPDKYENLVADWESRQ